MIMVHCNDAGLRAFVEEYAALIMPDRKLLRTDFFEHDGRWTVNLLLAEPGGQLLVNGQGQALCRFEKLTPLFQPIVRPGAAILAEDLLEQATVFRTRASRGQYENLQSAIKALQYSNTALADAYLAEQAGDFGVVDPLGNRIVPMEYASIETIPFEEELGTEPRGTAGLYLCRRPGHQINPMEVYDLMGHCIFRNISNVHPGEQALFNSKTLDQPQQKRLRSLWVTQQTIDQPFPEDPEFMIPKNETKRYTRKELSGHLSEELQTGGLDAKVRYTYRQDIPAEQLKELLFPMAEAIASAIDSSASEIISRLEDYEAFQRERSGNRFYLQGVTSDTTLDKVGLTMPTYTCLIRSGLRTLGDLQRPHKLRNSTPKILAEIDLLKQHLNGQT